MNKRGVVLIICYMAIAALTILGAALLVRSVSERSIASKYFDSTQAFWLAETGIQKALWELEYNNCAGCTSCSGNRCVSGTLTLPNSLSGTYNATISNGNTTITSVGSFPDTNTVSRTIRVDLNFKSVFQYGIFSEEKVYFKNSASIDSYDSLKGNYNVLLPDGISRNVNTNGDVGTNSAEAGAIELDNSSKINGDAYVGGSPETGIDAGPLAITGSRNGDINIPLPSVPVPTPPVGGWLSLPSGSSLGSGSYTASSLNLKNSTLTINGNVTLYITGAVDLKSSDLNIADGGQLTLYVDGTVNVDTTSKINNITKVPTNFILYSRYSSGTNGITFNNSTDLYGGIYAPDCMVTLQQSFQLYGALAAESASLFNSTKVHYDEALRILPTPFTTPTYSIQNWRERQNNDPSQSPF